MPPLSGSEKEERIRRIHESFIALMWFSKRKIVQQLHTFGLTFPQFVTLATLAAHSKPCTMGDLTNVTLQDAPTMTGIINRLVKMNVVERTRSEKDRRVVLVRVTPEGQELFEKAWLQTYKDDCEGYENFTDKDLNVLEQLIRYILHMYINPQKPLNEADVEKEIEKLRLFVKDPISYMKMEEKTD